MLDLILLGLLILVALRGYHAGFFMGIKNMVSTLGGLILSALLVKPFAHFLAENTGLETSISGWLSEKLSGVEFLSQDPLAGLPEILQEQMRHLVAEDALLTASASFVEALTALLISCIAFAILLLFSIVALRLAVNLLDSIMEATRLSSLVNHMAGAALYAAAYLLLVALLLYLLHPLLVTTSAMDIATLETLRQAIDTSLFVQMLENLIRMLGFF